jgi:hypothetical protein
MRDPRRLTVLQGYGYDFWLTERVDTTIQAIKHNINPQCLARPDAAIKNYFSYGRQDRDKWYKIWMRGGIPCRKSVEKYSRDL